VGVLTGGALLQRAEIRLWQPARNQPTADRPHHRLGTQPISEWACDDEHCLRDHGRASLQEMSEGDTLHDAARRIHEVLAGHVPEEIRTPHPRHRADRWPEKLAGRAVRGAEARGKHLLIRFDGDLTLHSHLRMSGTWGVYEGGRPWHRAPHKAWLVMRAGEWEVVQFDGPVLELVSDLRLRSDRRLAMLGPDVFGDSFDPAVFLAHLRRDDPGRPIGDALLDQRIVAGLGNVWKSEACFAVALDPCRPVGRVSDEEALAVVGFVREYIGHVESDGAAVGERAVVRGGAVVGGGAPPRQGLVSRPRAVYKRAGQPCLRCGSTVLARGQGENNRITFWCPGCQF
jgi:endonuclease VIII